MRILNLAKNQLGQEHLVLSSHLLVPQAHHLLFREK